MNLFEKYLVEAPGDENTPDTDTGPPDLPDEPNNSEDMDNNPPDLGDEGQEDISNDFNDEPPDLGGDDGTEDFNDDSFGDEEVQDPNQNMQLDEKIRAIMNENLYSSYLKLLNEISGQLANIRANNDIFRTLYDDSDDIVGELSRLEENMRVYINKKYINQDFGANRLFYDKCLNLLKILNTIFDKKIRKGIKETK